MLLCNPFETNQEIWQFSIAVAVEGLDRYNVGLLSYAVIGATTDTSYKSAVPVIIVIVVVNHVDAIGYTTLNILVVFSNAGI